MNGKWPPPKPNGFEFSPHRDGWAKWYKGQTRIVAVKSLDRTAVREAWDAKRKEIDAALLANAQDVRARLLNNVSIIDAAGQFYDWLDYRVTTGKPEPLSPFTAEDYKKTVNAFGKCVGPDTPLGSIGPSQFTAFAKTMSENAPTTVLRVVAYIHAFFAWSKDEGLIPAIPQYGRYFVKPPAADQDDVRLSVEKTYDIDALRGIYALARPEEKCWIILGLCGAMDNADIAHLTFDVLDRDKGLIDYRRRKRGKVRRVIPMRAEFWNLLNSYHRPAAADAIDNDRVFLTPEGLPLQRLKTSAAGKTNPIDYVAMRWNRLMIAAGLRPKMIRRRSKATKSLPRKFKTKGKASGQGFRALRTTFANLAPPGYRDEVEIIMGHRHGSVLLKHYLERFGVERLREVVDHIWTVTLASAAPPGSKPSSASASAKPVRAKRAARKPS